MPQIVGKRSRVLTLLGLLLLLAMLMQLASAVVTTPGAPSDYVPNQVIVGLRPNSGAVTISTLAMKLGMTVVSTQPALRAGVLTVPKGITPAQMVATLKRLPEVRFAQPNYLRYMMALEPPDDPAYLEDDPYTGSRYQWDLYLVQALEGWAIWPGHYYTSASKPRNAVKVAVLDTGVDTSHFDFINAGGISTSAVAGGQIDIADSGTTLKNYWNQSPNHKPYDDDAGHGTHCAGVIAAATNNGISYPDIAGGGMAGIAYNAQIMSIKVLVADGYGTDSDITAAIILAADRGAKVISMSLGGYGYSQMMQDAVTYAWGKGALVVAAAGNESNYNYPYVSYPAGYNRVLAVSATSIHDQLAWYSNFGPTIGIAAPGGDNSTGYEIWSTTPTYSAAMNSEGMDPFYSYMQGTSMATPHVAGLAGLYAGYIQATTGVAATPLQIYQGIQTGADNIDDPPTPDGGYDVLYGYGRMNVFNTIAGANPRSSTVGCITGQVLYQGSPLEFITVSATPAEGGNPYTDFSRVEDGCFRIPNIPPGTYTVSASYSGKSATVNDVVVTAGCDIPGIELNINPPLTGTIAGQVMDKLSGGDVLASVWVRRHSPKPTPWIAITDTVGYDYSVAGLTTGTYDVYITSVRYRSRWVYSVPVTSGKTTWLNVPLQGIWGG
jgi:thermitase